MGAGASPAPVTVAVVSYATRGLLEACLRSLERAARDALADVWVVDNASPDGSAAMVAQRFPWVHLLALADNRGFGAAVNEVAARTSGPWLLAANADVELLEGALDALRVAAENDPGLGAIAPRLLGDGDTTQPSVHPFPTPARAAILNLAVARVWPGVGERLCLPGHWDPDRPRDVDWALGAVMLLRRAAFEQVGGFDERRWMYAEDLDLGWRLRQAGWRTRYEPGARVRHRGAAATSAAFGVKRRQRELESAYDWLRGRRGVTRMRAVALINFCGALARVIALAPLARLDPGRWGRPLMAWREWASLHRRAGLRWR